MNAELAEWAALYQAGYSLRAIAERYGITHKAVLYHFRAAGVQTRSRNSMPPPSRLTWELDYCPNCDDERRLNPVTGWCSRCTLRHRNHPNTPTPFGTM